MKQRNEEAGRLDSSRILYPDLLRVISMAAVMVLHLAATGHTEAVTGSRAWVICWLYNYFSRFAVPVFVMISGAMMLDPDKDISTAMLWKKHISKLLRVFCGWSLVYALAESLKEHAFCSPDYFLCVAQKTITGHYHMWYLYMIMGLYLATPFLRKIAADRSLLKLFVILSFLLNSSAQVLRSLPHIGPVAETVLESADIGLFTGYCGYYCLGYLLHRTKTDEKAVRRFILLSAAVYGAVALCGAVIGTTYGISPDAMLNEKMPHTVLYSAGVFLFFKSKAESIERSEWLRNLLLRLVPCTLGMYLAHPMVNFALRKLGIYALTFDPLLCVPLCAALVYGVCYVGIAVMRKLPLAKRFV